MDSVAAQRAFDERQFVEEVGLIFEQVTLPRMAGRILGRLLLATPPPQSLGELTDYLNASKGSISTMTRLLLQFGLIERVAMPGERRDYFRITPHVWSRLITERMAVVTGTRRLAERGLELASDPETVAQLQEMRDFYAFFEREFPALIARWQEERG